MRGRPPISSCEQALALGSPYRCLEFAAQRLHLIAAQRRDGTGQFTVRGISAARESRDQSDWVAVFVARASHLLCSLTFEPGDIGFQTLGLARIGAVGELLPTN